MGNDLTKDLEMGKQTGSGGCGHRWKVYDAVNTRTKEKCSAWVLEKSSANSATGATEQLDDATIARLKQGVEKLTRLRHPNVVRVLSPMRENAKAMLFESERVMCSLSNASRNYTNLSPVPFCVESLQLDALEKKLGLLQLATGVAFLHRSANLIHLNLAAENVWLTAKSAQWKLCGLDFASFANYKPGTATNADMFHANEFNSAGGAQKGGDAQLRHPNLDYVAPEVVFLRRFDYASDVFALGCIMYAIYAERALLATVGNVLTYKQRVEHLHPLNLASLPADLHETLRGALAVDASTRWSATDVLTKGTFFKDVLLRSLMFLDSLHNKEAPLKAKFFKSLQSLRAQFSPRMLVSRVLPALCAELRSLEQVPFILPTLFAIANEHVTDRQFRERVLPALLPLLADELDDNVRIGVALLDNIEPLVAKSPAPVIASRIVRLVARAVDPAADARLQDIALRRLPAIASALPYAAVKQHIVPRMLAACTTPSLADLVRVNAIIALGKLFVAKLLDQNAAAQSLLPALDAVLRAEPSRPVVDAAVKVLGVVAKRAGPDLLATRVVPLLAPMLVRPNLERPLFDKLLATVRGHLDRIEQSRAATYNRQEQIDSAHGEQLDDADILRSTEIEHATKQQQQQSSFAAAPASSGAMSAEQMQYQNAVRREHLYQQKLQADTEKAAKHRQFTKDMKGIEHHQEQQVDQVVARPVVARPVAAAASSSFIDNDDSFEFDSFAESSSATSTRQVNRPNQQEQPSSFQAQSKSREQEQLSSFVMPPMQAQPRQQEQPSSFVMPPMQAQPRQQQQQSSFAMQAQPRQQEQPSSFAMPEQTRQDEQQSFFAQPQEQRLPPAQQQQSFSAQQQHRSFFAEDEGIPQIDDIEFALKIEPPSNDAANDLLSSFFG
jgi:SCY1-like protein 2